MALEITKPEQLETFLIDKPAQWSHLIAARVALRVLPVGLLGASEEQRLALFRGCLISQAAGKYPVHDMTFAAFSAHSALSAHLDPPGAELAAAYARYAGLDAANSASFSVADFAARSAATSARYATDSTAHSVYDSGADSTAFSAALSATWGAINADVDWLRTGGEGQSFADLALSPLWSGEAPLWVTKPWQTIAGGKPAADYAPWINWYQSLLTGNGPGADYFGPDLTLRIAQQPDEWWNRPPALVNADIAAWLAEVPESAVEIPAPEPGLIGTIDADGRVGFARSGEASADELAPVAGLLQVLTGAAEDLAALLVGNNAVAIAPSIVPQYLACLRAEALSIDRLYALGVRLGNARGKLQKQIDSKDYPDLAPDVAEALDSVLELHGPVLLSTAEGRRLVDASSDYLQTAADNTALKRAAIDYAYAVANSPDLFNKEARELLPQLNEDVGTGTHPERSTQVAMSASRNLLITVATVVLCETLKDGLAASVVGTNLTGVTAQTINFAWAFLTSNLPIIRELAAVSGPYLQWIEPLLRKAERRLRQAPLPPGQTGP
jgi:hypothetical protein